MFLQSDMDECVIDVFEPLSVAFNDVRKSLTQIKCMVKSMYFSVQCVFYQNYYVSLLLHCITFLKSFLAVLSFLHSEKINEFINRVK